MDKYKDRISSAERITSRTNPTVVRLAKLSQAKYRREEQLFLAQGVKLTRECLGTPEVRMVICAEENGTLSGDVGAIADTVPDGVRLIIMPSDVFAKICTEEAPQGIMAVLAFPERLHAPAGDPAGYAERIGGNRIFAVDEVRDPGNLGTILRTAAAFGYDRVLLSRCADLYNPKTVRAAMGALFRMKADFTDALPDVLSALRRNGRRVLAAALSDDSFALGSEPLGDEDVIVVGNEGHGLPDDIMSAADKVVRIPMTAGTESLNAAVASAVLMWEQSRGPQTRT